MKFQFTTILIGLGLSFTISADQHMDKKTLLAQAEIMCLEAAATHYGVDRSTVTAHSQRIKYNRSLKAATVRVSIPNQKGRTCIARTNGKVTFTSSRL